MWQKHNPILTYSHCANLSSLSYIFLINCCMCVCTLAIPYFKVSTAILFSPRFLLFLSNIELSLLPTKLHRFSSSSFSVPLCTSFLYFSVSYNTIRDFLSCALLLNCFSQFYSDFILRSFFSIFLFSFYFNISYFVFHLSISSN